jgi:hypothetical protein
MTGLHDAEAPGHQTRVVPNRLVRLARLATLPETRRLIVASARSSTLRNLRQRAIHDRPALLKDMVNPTKARHVVRDAVLHPATAELASAGLVFIPGRYLPFGWVATWATRRVLRRYRDRRLEVLRPGVGD